MVPLHRYKVASVMARRAVFDNDFPLPPSGAIRGTLPIFCALDDISSKFTRFHILTDLRISQSFSEKYCWHKNGGAFLQNANSGHVLFSLIWVGFPLNSTSYRGSQSNGPELALKEMQATYLVNSSLKKGVIMKVVIQHTVSQLYLKEGNSWTAELAEALNFGFMEKAAVFAAEQKLEDVQVAVIFTEIGQTFIYPVRPPEQ